MRQTNEVRGRTVAIALLIAAAAGLSACTAAEPPESPPVTAVGTPTADAPESAGAVPQDSGEPFITFPMCDEYINQTLSYHPEAAAALVGAALGRPDLAGTTEGMEMATITGKACHDFGMPSMLRALREAYPEEPLRGVRWTVLDGGGSWGGLIFPAEINGYRLVSEAEYSEFTSMYPWGSKCLFLGDVLYYESGISGTTVQAFYTSSDLSIAYLGCDAEALTISLYFSEAPIGTGLSSEPADVNGNHCQAVATGLCGVNLERGGWTAADLSSSLDLEAVSNFLSAAVAAN